MDATKTPQGGRPAGFIFVCKATAASRPSAPREPVGQGRRDDRSDEGLDDLEGDAPLHAASLFILRKDPLLDLSLALFVHKVPSPNGACPSRRLGKYAYALAG